MRGGATPIFTNAFLEQIQNILENLSNAKVFNVIKYCLKKLARAKNEMRAQKRKKSIFGATNFAPPPFKIFSNAILIPNQACRGPQIAWTAIHFNIWPQNMMCTHLAHLELGSLIFYPGNFYIS